MNGIQNVTVVALHTDTHASIHSHRTLSVITRHCHAPFTRYIRLSNRLHNRFDNQFDNRVERTATVRSTGCQTGLYSRLDNRLYTRYNRLSNRLTTGLTTGSRLYRVNGASESAVPHRPRPHDCRTTNKVKTIQQVEVGQKVSSSVLPIWCYNSVKYVTKHRYCDIFTNNSM